MEDSGGACLMFKYYGVDWLIFLCFLTHMYLIGNKHRSAFLVGMLGCTVGTGFGMMIDSAASITMNSVFFFMHLRAYLRWGRNE